MKKGPKSMFVLVMITAFVAAALFLPRLIRAGDLDPPSSAVDQWGNPVPTMTTLYEIYDKLESTPPPSLVEETGQTDCLAAGGDGYLDPRFTDNQDGTVTDNLTGLIWLRDPGCLGVEKWADALTKCNELEAGSCGLTDGSVQGDWRLPDVKELLSLIDYGENDPALSFGHPFTNVQSRLYWSSRSYEGNSANAWLAYMGSGSVLYDVKVHNRHVWPVRSGNDR